MLMLFFFEIPKGVLEKIESFRSRFFWQNDQHKKKYRIVKWKLICQPKTKGGLGVQDLEIQNKCLLSKWIVKLCNEDGMSQELLRNKYLTNRTLSGYEKKPMDSHFWKGLMNVKDTVLSYGTCKIGDGTLTRFSEDKWLGPITLKEKFPDLFNIVRRKHDTVAQVCNSSHLNISFRRNLTGNNLRNWNKLLLLY